MPATIQYGYECIPEFFETLLGLGVEPRDLTFIQISLRGIIVFLVTLATVRLGHKRLLSRKPPFDAVLLVILPAVLSRAINGSAAFFATLGGSLVLVILHRVFAFLTFYSHAYTRTTFPVFDSRAGNAAATSASSKK